MYVATYFIFTVVITTQGKYAYLYLCQVHTLEIIVALSTATSLTPGEYTSS